MFPSRSKHEDGYKSFTKIGMPIIAAHVPHHRTKRETFNLELRHVLYLRESILLHVSRLDALNAQKANE